MPLRAWTEHLHRALRTRNRGSRLRRRAADADFVRLRLTRLEDRVVLDGAAVVADLNPGAAGSAPAGQVEFNGSIYFSADGTDGSGQSVGRELHRLDPDGSVTLVADINAGPADSDPSEFVLFDGELLFAASGPQGRELYKLDASGYVTLVADVNPGAASANPEFFSEFNNKLYFAATGSAGREAYVVDGGGNASLVADINPGQADSNPSEFVEFGGNLYFAASGPQGRTLFAQSSSGNSDPEPIDLGAGVTDPAGMTEFAGALYFSAQGPTDGRELFKLTASDAGQTVVTKVANLDGTSANSSPAGFTVFEDHLYFAATTASGRELFQLDAAGNIVPIDIAPGAASSSPAGFTAFDGQLYFAATVGGQRGLYRLDTSGASPTAVSAALPSGVSLLEDGAFYPLGNELYFAADGPQGRELYVMNPAGVVDLAADINAGPGSSAPADLRLFGNLLYLVATEPAVGRELFALCDSSLRVASGTLVITDESGDSDNRLVIASDGANLIIRDESGHEIAILAPLAGATGSGTNEVTIPLASLAGANALAINTRGGNDSVTFDLSAHADALLGQFATSTFDGGDNAPDRPGDRLRFIGDGDTHSTYTPDASTTGSGVVIVSTSTQTTTFQFDHLEPVEFTAMASATLVAPATATGSDVLTIGEGVDAQGGLADVLIASGTVGGTAIESAWFFGNQSVVIDTGDGIDGTDQITVLGADNNHNNARLTIDTGAAGQDQVLISGDVALAGELTIRTFVLDVQAIVTLGGNAWLIARDDIRFSAPASLLALPAASMNVTLLADADGAGGGGIALAEGSLIDAGAGTIALTATGDIVLSRLITTSSSGAAITITTLGGAVLDGGDTGGANITAESPGAVVKITAQAGVGTPTNALDLQVRRLVVVTDGSDQYLSELTDLESIELNASQGQVVLNANGFAHDDDANTDVIAGNLSLTVLSAGTHASPLQTQIGALAATLAAGDLHLVEADGLAVLDVSASGAGGDVAVASLTGDILVQWVAAAGLVSLQASQGAIQQTGGQPIAITAADLELSAASGVGTTAAPLVVDVDRLEADGGSGGVFLQNSGNLQIGGISSSVLNLSGLSATGSDIVVAAGGSLTTIESVQTTGAGAIVLRGVGDIALQALVSSANGDIDLAATRSIFSSAAGDIRTAAGTIRLTADSDSAGGGTLQVAGDIDVGSGQAIFSLPDSTGQASGIISGSGGIVKQGLGTLTLAPTSINTYTGTTDVLAGTLRVDGAIGAAGPAQRVTLAGGTTLTGGGDVNAPVFSSETATLILPAGNLRLGDGSSSGFEFAGTMTIPGGDAVTLRDADLAELGLLTQIDTGGRVTAINGIEVGAGESLVGGGEVAGSITVLAGGLLSPGASPGVLTTNPGDLTLQRNAVYRTEIFGHQPATEYDQLIVSGAVSVNGAILDIEGGDFDPESGAVFTIISNVGSEAVTGTFRDPRGNVLQERAIVRFGNVSARISYVGGPGGNDVVLDTRLVPSANAALVGGAFLPRENERQAAPRLPPRLIGTSEAAQAARQTDGSDTQAAALEVQTAQRLRVFFRLVNEGTGQEEPKEFELDPGVLRDLLAIFKRFRFQEGRYRIYLQEPGKRERLILDVNVLDGKVVPPNFRDAEIIPESGAPPAAGGTAPPGGAAEEPLPPANPAAPPTNPPADAALQPAAEAGAELPDWSARVRALLTSDEIPASKFSRLLRRIRPR
jgi:ELWxxDGT repeat protein/autotransporter-associated beta strand protein